MADVPTPDEPKQTIHCSNCKDEVTLNQCETHVNHMKDGLCYPEHLIEYHRPKEEEKEGEKKKEMKIEA